MEQEEEAALYYERSRQSYPGYIIATFNLASIKTRKGLYDEALALYNSVMQYHPSRTLHNIAELYMNGYKDNEKALEYINKALLLDPTEMEGYRLLSVYHYRNYVKTDAGTDDTALAKKVIDSINLGMIKVTIHEDLQYLMQYKKHRMESFSRNKHIIREQLDDWKNFRFTDLYSSIKFRDALFQLQQANVHYKYYHSEHSAGYYKCKDFLDIIIIL